jgi:ribonuclease D
MARLRRGKTEATVMVVQTDRDLAAFCDEVRGFPALFVDTEFVGEGRYYPDVGAIQVAAGGQTAVVDPLAVRDFSPLRALLVDPEVEKVFHAAGQDLGIFSRLLGEPVTPVFDAQIAAAMLGYDEQISFARLVERTTGVKLRKSHSFTDWLRRPLTPRQIEYAAEDVRYLEPAYEQLVKELAKRGRLSWAREEFSSLSDPARFVPTDPREVFLQIRGAERLNGEELCRLRQVAAWREETARALNLPPGRICMDPVLIELARHPRRTAEELQEVRGLRPPQVERFGRGLLAALHRTHDGPCPTFARSRPLPARLEPTVDFLVLCLRSLAAKNEVSAGLLATRSDLTAIVLHGARAKVPLMRGWRREAVGETLLATLEGRATVRVLPDSRQVHLEWHPDPAPLPVQVE